MKPDDPDLNEHIAYAKCVKGHVLRDAQDWILCENLPAEDAQCWQEGGETLLSIQVKKRNALQERPLNVEQKKKTPTTQASKS